MVFWGTINCVRFLLWVWDEKYRCDNEHNKGPLMSTGTKKATYAFQWDRTFIPSWKWLLFTVSQAYREATGCCHTLTDLAATLNFIHDWILDAHSPPRKLLPLLIFFYFIFFYFIHSVVQLFAIVQSCVSWLANCCPDALVKQLLSQHFHMKICSNGPLRSRFLCQQSEIQMR